MVNCKHMIKFFNRDKEPKNIEEILAQFKELEKTVKGLSAEIESFRKEKMFSVQKVGIIRFNPFSGVGSDQSFSVALLDGNNSGVVITSLFSQDGNRVYAKPVEKGESKYVLSEEEKKAIKQALGQI